MISDAIKAGQFTKDKILIDSTSGNTGIAYAWICAALGFRCALVMPANVSSARKQLTRMYGAEQIFSDPITQITMTALAPRKHASVRDLICEIISSQSV